MSAHALNGFANGLLGALAYSQTLDPAGGQVHASQGIEVLAFCGLPTVRHHVDFQESWLVFIPRSVSAHRDGLLQQAAGLGCALTMRMLKAHRAQTTINRRTAHFQQECFGRLRQLQFTTALQHLHDLRQKRMEPLCTDPPAYFPDLLQRDHDFTLVDLDYTRFPANPSRTTIFQ